MKQKRLIIRSSILAVIMIVLGYTFYSNFFADKSVVRAGDPAINFALTDINGERIGLNEQKGKRVVLYFWATF